MGCISRTTCEANFGTLFSIEHSDGSFEGAKWVRRGEGGGWHTKKEEGFPLTSTTQTLTCADTFMSKNNTIERLVCCHGCFWKQENARILLSSLECILRTNDNNYTCTPCANSTQRLTVGVRAPSFAAMLVMDACSGAAQGVTDNGGERDETGWQSKRGSLI